MINTIIVSMGVIFGTLAIILCVWSYYDTRKKYKKLLVKNKIVVDHLCDYLEDDLKEESEWGNVR